MGFRSGPSSGNSFQALVPLTPVVKRLMLISVSVWLVFQVILEQLFLRDDFLIRWFGLSPAKVVFEFQLWQTFTYLFLHSTNPTHILMNMLMLWWLGAELEQRWGPRFFGLYYFVCGVGAAFIYILVSTGVWIVTGQLTPMLSPVIGASGAVFGLLLAYGILFGERVVLFMFLFQMKAKYFVMILGMIEVVLAINNGVGGSPVANLAHLGGLISGFLFLSFWTRYQQSRKGPKGTQKGRLQIIVNKDSDKTWH